MTGPAGARTLVADRLLAGGFRVLYPPVTIQPQDPPCALVDPAVWAQATGTACGAAAWKVQIHLVAGDPAGADNPADTGEAADSMFDVAWLALRPISLADSEQTVVAGRWLARSMTVEVLA